MSKKSKWVDEKLIQEIRTNVGKLTKGERKYEYD
jgi:hypothetical protein